MSTNIAVWTLLTHMTILVFLKSSHVTLMLVYGLPPYSYIVD